MPMMPGFLLGMLAMILPAFAVCCAITIVAYRRRGKTTGGEDGGR